MVGVFWLAHFRLVVATRKAAWRTKAIAVIVPTSFWHLALGSLVHNQSGPATMRR
jgi:hypothetical protein